jgi:cytochrome c oxidase cbb3-type subunit 3
MADNNSPDRNDVETTGHVWDGIEELNTPLPRWWLWTFYATLLWGLVYTIAYPAWPLINGATEGFLGYSTRGELAEDLAAHEAKNAELTAALAATAPADLAANADLHRYAVARGGAVFLAHCSQCHGSGAAGAVGYPNLLDDDWLWGGDAEAIAFSIRHGIRNDTDDDARYSEMPKFGEFLEEDELAAVVAYAAQLGRLTPPAGADLDLGAQVFTDNCVDCHGEGGGGDRELGAPNLTDAVWLYGDSLDALDTTIREARFGVMPAWGGRLSEADVNAVAAYVHALGGGE